MLLSNTDGKTYAKETPRSVLLDICYSWNKNQIIFTPATVQPEKSIYSQCHLLTACMSVCAFNLMYRPHCYVLLS